MELLPVAEAPLRIAELDPVERPLPSMVMADAAAAGPKRHAWPGTLFYGASYLMAAGLAVVSVLGVVSALDQGWELRFYALPVIGAAWSAAQWRLAREVRRFTRWGWYGAVAETGASILANVWGMAQGEVGGGLCGAALSALLLRYFWKRRAQFDIDPSL